MNAPSGLLTDASPSIDLKPSLEPPPSQTTALNSLPMDSEQRESAEAPSPHRVTRISRHGCIEPTRPLSTPTSSPTLKSLHPSHPPSSHQTPSCGPRSQPPTTPT